MILLLESLFFIPILGDKSASQYPYFLLLLLRPSCVFWHRRSLPLNPLSYIDKTRRTKTRREKGRLKGRYSFAVLSRIGHFSRFVGIIQVSFPVSFLSFY